MSYPSYGPLDGPVVMIGFGSIGRGTLPLVLRHFEVKPEQVTVVAPDDANAPILARYGVQKITALLTPDNYRDVLAPLLTAGAGRAFCVNLSVDTSSVAIMALARELGALYIDTVIEPWPGFYDDHRSRSAPITRCARACWLSAAAAPAARRRSRPAEPTRAWCRGSSSRLCWTLRTQSGWAPSAPPLAANGPS
jgi:homospermidine synthase